MAWNDLKAAVAAVIKTNGTQSITGVALQSTLNSIIDQVGANSTFKGVATTSTNPGTPDGPVFYLASTEGTYANFGGVTIARNELAVFNYTNAWGKISIATNVAKLIDIQETLQKTAKASYGKNLFNRYDANVIQGQYISLSGAFGTNANYYITGFIPISSGQTLVKNGTFGGGGYTNYYDSNFNLIGTPINTQTIPFISGAAYIRTCFDIAIGTAQIEIGSVPTAYAPYTDIANKVSGEALQDSAVSTSKIKDSAVTGSKLETDYKNLLDVYYVKNSETVTLYGDRAAGTGIQYPSSEGCAWAMAYTSPSNVTINGMKGKPTKTLSQVWLTILTLPDDLVNKPTNPVVVLELDVTEKWNANIGVVTEFYFGDFNMLSGKNYGFGFRTTGDNIGYYPSTQVSGIDDARPRISATTGTNWSYAIDSQNNVPYAVLGSFDLVQKKGAKVGNDYIEGKHIKESSVSGTKLTNNSVAGTKLMDNSISGPKLVDSSITEKKSQYFDASKNLFNPDDPDCVFGYYISQLSGVPSANALYNGTGFIPVTPGVAYAHSYSHQSAWFDANKNYISGFYEPGVLTHTAPVNAAYIRLTVYVGSWSTFQFEVGTVPTSYVPFGFTLKTKYLQGLVPDVFTNDICIPAKLYMLANVQNNIFIEPLIKRWRPYNDVVRFAGTTTYQRRLQRVASILSPVEGNTVQLSLVNTDKFLTVKTKTSTLVVGTPGTGSGNIYASVVGDSVTNAAFFASALLAKGYVPNINLIGLRDVSGYSGQFDEGRGGWTLANYFNVTTGRTSAYNGFWQPDGVYKYWGSTHFWKLANDIRLNPSGPWTFDESYNAGRFGTSSLLFNPSTGYKSTPALNDIMYDNDLGSYVIYNGSAWVATTYATYTWNFNYGKYLTMWSLTAPSIIFESLGLNDFRGASDPENISFTTWNSQMNTFIQSYLSAVPTGKFVLLTPLSTCGILDNTAGDFTIKQNAAMWSHRKNIIDNFDGREAEQIYVVDAGIAIDNIEGYDFTNTTDYTKPYSGYTGTQTIRVQTGNPHPYPNYPNMGISLAAFIQKFR